ncbi:hypothetical protein IW261DRAFT_1423702 [Armillaria novae-zelandiae]|uniref:Uncharacterized protein n=1 Tax=Armillaria novae-zelandiae TaxID=153914 RepID=A0AA39NWU0_9AGAR|nr:hypothetical protein IW261DRAFT_1423702 [Armillaria novae-zelandiae]
MADVCFCAAECIRPQSFTEALTERYGPAIPIFIESDSSIFSEVSAAEAADFCPKTTYRHPASWTLHQDHLKSDFQSLGLHRWETLCPNDVSSSDFCPEATYRLPASWAMHHQYLRFLSRDAVSTSGELNCDSSLTPKFQTFLPYRAGIKIPAGRKCRMNISKAEPACIKKWPALVYYHVYGLNCEDYVIAEGGLADRSQKSEAVEINTRIYPKLQATFEVLTGGADAITSRLAVPE